VVGNQDDPIAGGGTPFLPFRVIASSIPDRSRVDGERARHGQEEGGLARAVGPCDGHDPPPRTAQSETSQDLLSASLDMEIVDLEKGFSLVKRLGGHGKSPASEAPFRIHLFRFPVPPGGGACDASFPLPEKPVTMMSTTAPMVT
jgi:hypothetical protein